MLPVLPDAPDAALLSPGRVRRSIGNALMLFALSAVIFAAAAIPGRRRLQA
jgi:hypothetical protein